MVGRRRGRWDMNLDRNGSGGGCINGCCGGENGG